MQTGKENWKAWGLVVAGCLAVISSLILTLLLTTDISTNFLLDVGYAIGGALFVWGVSKFRQTGEKRNNDNEVIALVANFRNGTNQPDVNDNILGQISGYSHDQVRKSNAKSSMTNVATHLSEANQRWRQAFPLLSQCSDFDRAWNLYFAMGNNIANASVYMQEMDDILDDLWGNERNAENANTVTIPNRMVNEITIAARSLQAAISRRDESSEAIPSLQTLDVPLT